MAKKKISRKVSLTESDPIVESTGKVFGFIKENQKQLLLGVGVIVLLVVGFSSFQYIAKGKEDKSFFTFNQLVTTYEEALSKEDSSKALEVVKDEFVKLIKGYSGYSGGKLAQLYFAHLCFDGGNTDLAIEHYQAALKNLKGDPLMEGIILNGLGYAYLVKKDGEKAETYFKQLADGNAIALKDMALFNLAKSYELKGETDKSTASYNKIVADHPDSIFFNVIKEKVAG